MYTYALINNGGSTITFINIYFAALYKFLLTQLRYPLILNIINNRTISLGQITHYTKVVMRIQNYSKRVPFILINLGHYPIILGVKQLQKHNITIKWGANIILLNSPYYKENYLKSGRTIIILGIVNMLNTSTYLQQSEIPLKINLIITAKKKRKKIPAQTQQSRRRKLK